MRACEISPSFQTSQMSNGRTLSRLDFGNLFGKVRAGKYFVTVRPNVPKLAPQ